MSDIEKILSELGSHGVCETGRRWLGMQEKGMETLVRVWRRWPEYCQEHHDFLVGILRENMDEGGFRELACRRLFVDWEESLGGLVFEHEPIFLLGDSRVRLQFGQFGVARIYCHGNSRLFLTGDATCKFNIDMYGDSLLYVSGGVVPNVRLHDSSRVVGNARVRRVPLNRGEVFNGEELDVYDTRTW